MKAATSFRVMETRRVSVREGYALWAASYDRHPNPLLVLEERTVASMLPGVLNRRVLDVACGTGRWMTKLAGLGAESVFGLDLSPQMLARAEEKVSLRGRLAQADCRRIPICSGTIDLVLCSFAAGYLGELTGLIREISRIARPRAEIFLSDVHPSFHRRGWKRAFRHGTQVLEIENKRHSIAEIVHACQASGLAVVDRAEPHWGTPEERIFQSAGKLRLYQESLDEPVIFVLRLRRSRCGEEGRMLG
ncbi:MAG: class I SAM-dependent methyltransferase [Terriglobia bacterium]